MKTSPVHFLLLIIAVNWGLSLTALAQTQLQSTGSSCPPPLMSLDQQMAHINDAPAKNAGFLWRVEKDGRTSWLYGTMHLNDIDHAKPGPQTMMGMRNSDVLAVEVNPYEPQTLSVSMQQPELKLSSGQLDKLSKAYARDCLAFNAASISPLSLTGPLLNAQAQRKALFWGYSPDARLAQIAKRTSKPIVSLETLAQHLTVLMPASQAEFDNAFDSTLNAVESGRLQTELVQLNKAWRQNDWQAIVKLEQDLTIHQSAFAIRLLDQRNLLMAEKIDVIHQDGKRVFVAVGAMHMAGKTALPKLLQDKGYAVVYIPLRN